MTTNIQETSDSQEETDEADIKGENSVENKLADPEIQAKIQKAKAKIATDAAKAEENKVVKLLEKNTLGMTLPEMAGGIRKQKRIKQLRPILAEAIKKGIVMPVSQRSGHTVYKLVRNLNR